ncbi:hypothetical protein [Halomonas sp. N3-2A]|nr:hypothetical protein [Halomonas sp. N3-2A]
MSAWILIAVAIVGAAFLFGLGLYLTDGYDDQGEPLEYRYDHD